MGLAQSVGDTIARLTGLRVTRARPMRSAGELLQLKATEAGVRTILDIGAHVGEFGTSLRRTGWRGTIVSFEPVQEAHAKLRQRAADDPLWIVPPAMALGAKEGEAVINLSENYVSSSLLPVEQRSIEAACGSRLTGTEAIMLRRLDNVVDPCWQRPLAIKVDTQGFELEVLRGAVQTLSTVKVALLEMSLSPLYAGGVSFCELFSFMEDNGFRCIALVEGFANSTRNEVLQVDGVFLRD